MYKVNATTWDIWAIVFGIFDILFGLAFFFAAPTVSVFGKNVAVSHGMIVMAVIVGSIVWMLVEMLTMPKSHWYDILVRFFISYFVGFFVGAFLAYYMDWGQYVLIPALNGNVLALAELLATFAFFIAVTINAIYLHNKTFRKMKGSPA